MRACKPIGLYFRWLAFELRFEIRIFFRKA